MNVPNIKGPRARVHLLLVAQKWTVLILICDDVAWCYHVAIAFWKSIPGEVYYNTIVGYGLRHFGSKVGLRTKMTKAWVPVT